MYIINKRYEKYIPKDFDYEKLGSRFNEVLNYLKSEQDDYLIEPLNGIKVFYPHENNIFVIELITNLILADMLSLQKINNYEVISLIKYQISVFNYINDIGYFRYVGRGYRYKYFQMDLFSDLNFIIKNLDQLEYSSIILRKSKYRELKKNKVLKFTWEDTLEQSRIEIDNLRTNIKHYKSYRVESALSYFDIKFKGENDLKNRMGLYVPSDTVFKVELDYINNTLDKLENFIQSSLYFAKENSLPIQSLCYVLLYNISGLHDGRTYPINGSQIINIDYYIFRDPLSRYQEYGLFGHEYSYW